MKIERTKKGTEIVSKLDGKNYRVTAVLCDEAGKVTEATAAEMIENEGEVELCVNALKGATFISTYA